MLQDRLVEILGARFACVDEGFGTNKPVDAVIRPEDVELVEPSQGILQGVVTNLIFKGVHYEMEVMANGYEWLVHSTKMFPTGTAVGLCVELRPLLLGNGQHPLQQDHSQRTRDYMRQALDFTGFFKR